MVGRQERAIQNAAPKEPGSVGAVLEEKKHQNVIAQHSTEWGMRSFHFLREPALASHGLEPG